MALCINLQPTNPLLQSVVQPANISLLFGALAKMNRGNSKKTPTSAPSTRKRSRRQARLPPGTVIVRYKELLGSVHNGTTQFLFVPGSSGLPHLDARGRMYEMYRLRGPVRVQYRAAVGTTTNGEVLIGVDYDAKDAVLTYQGTAALSPKSMTPVWKDSVLVVPHNRAMKQKWLVTAADITPTETGGTPTNYRDDAVAFGLNITSTGSSATGSVWIEYNVEFASPRVPEPLVNATIANTTSAANILNRSGYTCPVDPGQSFYIASTSGTPNLGSGYVKLDDGSINGMGWTLVKRDESASSGIWGSISGLTNSLTAILTSENLNALYRAYKAISFS